MFLFQGIQFGYEIRSCTPIRAIERWARRCRPKGLGGLGEVDIVEEFIEHVVIHLVQARNKLVTKERRR